MQQTSQIQNKVYSKNETNNSNNILIMAKINTAFANYVANNDAKTGAGITFQNVKTQTINVAMAIMTGWFRVVILLI